MKQGWICIHRKIQDSDFWIDEEPFDKRSAWIDMLLMANHEDKKMIFDGHRVEVKRGQFITSVRKLSDRWLWGKDKTLRYLRLLEELQMIDRESNTRRTLVTIVNYGKYQDMQDTDKDSHKDTDKDTDASTNETLTRQLTRQSCDTDKPQTTNINNDNNVNNIRTMFRPPSVDDVRAYCQERHNNVNPESFVNFYESKGWLVGKNKMKDWKAAVRTWEQKDKKPKNKFNNFDQRDYDYNNLERMLLNSNPY